MHAPTMESRITVVLLIISLRLIACQAQTGCAISAAFPGETAILTCDFRVNVSDTKDNFTVDFTKQDNPKRSVLTCIWENENTSTPDCYSQDSFKLQSDLAQTAKIKFPAEFETQGEYVCQLLPDEESVPCTFTLLPEECDDTYYDTIEPDQIQEKEDDDIKVEKTTNTFVSIIFPAFLGVFFLLILIFAVIRRKKPARKPASKDSWAESDSGSESKEPKEPAPHNPYATLEGAYAAPSDETIRTIMSRYNKKKSTYAISAERPSGQSFNQEMSSQVSHDEPSFHEASHEEPSFHKASGKSRRNEEASSSLSYTEHDASSDESSTVQPDPYSSQ